MRIGRRLVCVVATVFAMGGCGLRAQTARTATPLENTYWKLTWLPGTKIESLAPQQTAYIELEFGEPADEWIGRMQPADRRV